jgi:hypothetical protein
MSNDYHSINRSGSENKGSNEPEEVRGIHTGDAVGGISVVRVTGDAVGGISVVRVTGDAGGRALFDYSWVPPLLLIL